MALRKPPPQDGQLELFSAVFTDIVTRDIQDAMEVPFLSLSKKPRVEPILYSSKGVDITVTGGAPYGIANIWDWDLIMWLLSQVREAIDKGHPVSRQIRFHRHAFLKSARRDAGGVQYRRLEDTIARLKNTNVVTTVRAADRRTVMFSWLEYVHIDRDDNGRLRDATVVLPEWLFEAVRDRTLILSLHPDYFLLTGGIERWLYRFIRKQAGNSITGWKWRLETLHERSGSTQRLSDFATAIRDIVRDGNLLDYELVLRKEEGQELLYAKRISPSAQKVPEVVPSAITQAQFLRLKTMTYEKAKALAPGYDIYSLEEDWRRATQKKGLVLNDPDAAFLAWCKKVAERPVKVVR
ncbi:replication initiator protein A [Nodosilinea sp. LEGE 07298]|uniref:replication initiator protein A n=1 Tax=Nodosilinea sp. LEGE 07298 TaxID=2777970 RepID=UPI00187EFFEE|nr:replication initiator protein A [Nodosilinea sp. LEGE 07298]MBE9108275.1 replication initiator protein A [Nodosilinea sp. LEGE 07298]